MTNQTKIEVNLHEFCHDLIHGTGGFIALETYELFSPADRDVAIVEFTIRALANIGCENADQVLDAIREQRGDK